MTPFLTFQQKLILEQLKAYVDEKLAALETPEPEESAGEDEETS